MRAQYRLQLAEQMRKQAYFGEGVVDMFNPLTSMKSMGSNFADMGTHATEGSFGKALWSGAKGLVDGAGVVPGVGFAAKGLSWAGKGVGLLGKGVGSAGKFVSGTKGQAGLTRRMSGGLTQGIGSATGGTGNLTSRAATGVEKFSDKMTNKMLGKVPGGQWAPAIGGAGMTGAEMGTEAVGGRLTKWNASKLPEPPGTNYGDMALGHLRANSNMGNPLNAGHNVEFPR